MREEGSDRQRESENLCRNGDFQREYYGCGFVASVTGDDEGCNCGWPSAIGKTPENQTSELLMAGRIIQYKMFFAVWVGRTIATLVKC